MERTKQRATQCIALLVCLIIPLSLGISAKAATTDPMQPMYIGIVSLSPRLVISPSGTISCTDTVSLKNGYSANITWELKHGTGNTLSKLSSWTASGKGEITLSKGRQAIRGYSYQLKATAKVYDSNGNYIETAVKYSSVVSYYKI